VRKQYGFAIFENFVSKLTVPIAAPVFARMAEYFDAKIR